MTEPVDPRITAFRASHERLRALTEPLTGDELRQPAYPSEWSIAQVLSHLGSGAEIYLMLLNAALAGAEAPSRDSYPSVWARWNGKSPQEQASDAVKATALLVEKLEAHAGSAVAVTIWSGPTDVPGVAMARLSEHAVHTWDVAVALDPAAVILPAAVDLMIDTVDRVVARTAKPSPWSGVLRVATIDPAREFALNLGESASLTPWSAEGTGEFGASLELPSEAFIRLVYGRLDADHTPPQVTTNGIGVADLRVVFQGF